MAELLWSELCTALTLVLHIPLAIPHVRLDHIHAPPRTLGSPRHIHDHRHSFYRLTVLGIRSMSSRCLRLCSSHPNPSSALPIPSYRLPAARPRPTHRTSPEVLLQPLIVSRNESERVLIEPSVNSLRLSIAIKQADEIEKILCHKFTRFMMMRAEGFVILRRKPLPVSDGRGSFWRYRLLTFGGLEFWSFGLSRCIARVVGEGYGESGGAWRFRHDSAYGEVCRDRCVRRYVGCEVRGVKCGSCVRRYREGTRRQLGGG